MSRTKLFNFIYNTSLISATLWWNYSDIK